ncbi:stress response protein NST1-like isoform X2 [Cornus florida]|uniref:stress response protein NST1-like isoform X2 n=1 Tax=Cornus florida TaxID=4283 RepID=UPI00289B58F2|nr:stress response protein NST1-like isoform X2 [Cornus florida]
MCILCVIQKWSRRVATMLPWLVIPLIGLWALSQLLPPAFRFEITSPRLACVLVLLVTLFWYEVLMPQLSTWRVRRNARLRERKRFEAIEMQKLRKTATRRCRNCLTPYRDQNPGGGRFMCSYCGHISKRPVLDLPIPPGLGLSNSGILKDLVGRSGKILNGKMWADNGWMCGQDWLENGNWVGGSFAGKSNYWQRNGGGFFGGDDHCMAEKSYSCVVMFACKILMAFFLSIGWLWRKITRVTSSGDDSSLDAEQKGMLDKRGENGMNFNESRGEKARRKAEEKRQARLERELLEEEERKQREEVARLVEERRRLRDEKEAEKDRGKGLATAREKASKKEAERKRQERRKEKDRGSSKSNSDVEELDRKVGKESERKQDFDRKSETDRWEHLRSGAESAKGHSMETGHGFKVPTVNNPGRGNTGSRYLDRVRGTFLSSSRAFTGGSFFGRGASTANISRESKPTGSVDHIQNPVKGRMLSQAEHVNENITRPVLVESQPATIPKKSWQQLFTRSPDISPPSHSNVISRPNGKAQAEAQSPPFSGQSSSIQLYDNPINFGSPFTLPTSPYGSTSSSTGFSFASEGSSTVLPLASEAMFPRIGEAPCEFLSEESDIFEDPCYVPDPVSLLGPVSESLDNFQLDVGVGFNDLGLEKPRALNNISAPSEVNRPSPIESPMMSRSRVSDERYSSSNRFPITPKAQDGFASPMDSMSNANEKGTWQMWNTSPLGQNGLGLLGDPGSWLLPAELNGSNKEDVAHPTSHKTMASLFTNDDKSLSGTYSPQNVFLGNCKNGGTFGTSLPSTGDDPWLPKTLFGPCENHFSLNPSEEISHQHEMIYGSPSGSASNPPFELSPANCWAKKDWSVQSSGEGIGNSTTSRPHVGGLYSTPDVQSLWSV